MNPVGSATDLSDARKWLLAGGLTGAWLAFWTVLPFWLLERSYVNDALKLPSGRGWEPFLALTMHHRWGLSPVFIDAIPLMLASVAVFMAVVGALLGLALRHVIRSWLFDGPLNSLASLRWSLQQLKTAKGLLLLSSLFVVPMIGWVIRGVADNFGYSISWWAFAPLQAAYLLVILPVLLSPPNIVGGTQLGTWWRAARLPFTTLNAIALTVAVGIALSVPIRLVAGPSFLAAVVGLSVSTLTGGLISMLLLIRPDNWKSAATAGRMFMRAENALPWFGSTLIFGWAALVLSLPLIGLGLFSVFAVPTLIDELRRAGVAEADWLRTLRGIEDLRSAYGSVVFIVVLLPIFAAWTQLWDQRFAFLLHTQRRAALGG